MFSIIGSVFRYYDFLKIYCTNLFDSQYYKNFSNVLDLNLPFFFYPNERKIAERERQFLSLKNLEVIFFGLLKINVLQDQKKVLTQN